MTKPTLDRPGGAPTPLLAPLPQSRATNRTAASVPARRNASLSLLSLWVLAACGGGEKSVVLPGGGGSGTLPPPAVVPAPPAPVGPASPGAVAAFGSVTSLNPLVVAGVQFAVDLGTAYAVGDGQVALAGASAAAGLALGMTAAVSATTEPMANSPRAWRVIVRADLVGQLEAVSATALRVAGQLVGLESATVLGGVANATQLEPGDWVAVYGAPRLTWLAGITEPVVSTEWLASRVERLPQAPSALQLSGGVLPNACATCAPALGYFRINSTVLLATPAAVAPPLALPLPLGALVRASGSAAALPPVLVALSVRPYWIELPVVDAVVTVTGFVTRAPDGGLWLLGLPLLVTSQTELEAGIDQEWGAQRLVIRGVYRAGRGIEAFVVRRL